MEHGRLMRLVWGVHPRRGSLWPAALVVLGVLAGCGSKGAQPDAGERDASGLCASDAMCDDGLFCNGAERCDPASPTADVDGCAPAEAPPCLAAQTCDEDEDLCRTECDITGDADGDGHDDIGCGGDDCDDAHASTYPGNVELCDPEGRDEDCDPTTLGVDADDDGDGHARPECCNPQADGTTLCGDDCDDSRATVNPAALEVCDADIDNDCNGLADAADGVCVPCADGYRGFDVACEDIDECATGAPCGGASGAMCVNTPGSYRCVCPEGYQAPPTAGTCEDVDECAAGAPCGANDGTTCINIPGAYVCSCAGGYSSPAVGGTCSDIDECATGTPCGVAAGTSCVNSLGSYSCLCPPGFAAPASGGTCADMDECATGTPCGRPAAWSSCGNVFGSYACVCSAGYIAPPSGGSCRLDEPSLASLVPSVGVLSPAFDPSVTSYTWELSWGASMVSLTPSVLDPAGAVIRVEGVVVASGSASAPIAVVGGVAQRIQVEVTTETGRVLTYDLNIAPRASYLKASNTDGRDYFGRSVALSGDGRTIAVGAPSESSSASGIDGDQADNTGHGFGAVYVFRRTGDTWIQEAYVKASNPGPVDMFGSSLALSADGSTLVVGAPGEQSSNPADPLNNVGTNVGAAYVFTRSGGVWAQRAYLKAAAPASDMYFAMTLSLSSDASTLAVGTVSVGGAGSEEVYVFRQAAGMWTQEGRFTGSNTRAGDSFSRALSLSADGAALAVGAPTEDSAARGVGGDGMNNAAADAGAVYLFSRSGTSWTEQAYVKASNTDPGDWFGVSVALSADGTILAVGAQSESSATTGVAGSELDNSAPFAGAVYVFSQVAGAWSQQAYIKGSNAESRDSFGSALALTADGQTLVVGAPGEGSSATGVGGDQADNSLLWAGAAYVFSQVAGAWSQRAYVKATNTGRADRYGESVAVSADANVLICGANTEASNATGVDGDGSDNSLDQSGAVYAYVN